MNTSPSQLIIPLLRAVQSDKPIPDGWRQPLAHLAALLTLHRDEKVSVRAVRVLIAMEAANLRNAGDLFGVV